MRLIRNTTPDGSCKYRLWNNALGRFEDDDKPGDLNEFFAIKLKDRNSEAALLAYAAAIEPRDPEFAADVRELAARAGPNHPACKDPDNAPVSAPVEDVGGLMRALVIADRQVTAMRSQMYRAADMIEAADKTRAKINASNVRAWVTPTIEDANRRDILAALSPSLIQPQRDADPGEYPPPCSDPGGHSWVCRDDNEEISYCEHCGADGNA